MHVLVSTVFALLALFSLTAAKVVVVTVGGNTTDNPGGTFNPPTVDAHQGDVVYFNFTMGNHTVTQSTFPAPCIRAHDFNQTLNGFDSSFRNAGNGTAITNLQVPITDNSTTIWYFDWNTCAVGGVGAININTSSLETYDGFVRNAMRLNGSEADATSTSSAHASSQASATAPSPASSSSASSDATRAIVRGATGVVPLLFLGAFAFLL